MNLTKCPNCNRSLIIEELENHECRKVLDYRIEDDILWLFDGEIWYPRKLMSNRQVTQRRTTDNETEPNLVNHI